MSKGRVLVLGTLRIKLLGYDYRPATPRITVVNGYRSENPGNVETWACPSCTKGSKPHGVLVKFKPVLVRVHRSEPLELHYCVGCPNLLIKVASSKPTP